MSSLVFQTTAIHSILIHPLTLTPQQCIYMMSSVAPSVNFTSHHSLEYEERMLDPANTRSLRALASSTTTKCKKAVIIIGQLLGASIALVMEIILEIHAFSVHSIAPRPNWYNMKTFGTCGHSSAGLFVKASVYSRSLNIAENILKGQLEPPKGLFEGVSDKLGLLVPLTTLVNGIRCCSIGKN